MNLGATVYALHSAAIGLCLGLFRWARSRRTKSAIKRYPLLDLRGPIPAFIHVRDGKLHNVHALDQMPVETGSFKVRGAGVWTLPASMSSTRSEPSS